MLCFWCTHGDYLSDALSIFTLLVCIFGAYLPKALGAEEAAEAEKRKQLAMKAAWKLYHSQVWHSTRNSKKASGVPDDKAMAPDARVSLPLYVRFRLGSAVSTHSVLSPSRVAVHSLKLACPRGVYLSAERKQAKEFASKACAEKKPKWEKEWGQKWDATH